MNCTEVAIVSIFFMCSKDKLIKQKKCPKSLGHFQNNNMFFRNRNVDLRSKFFRYHRSNQKNLLTQVHFVCCIIAVCSNCKGITAKVKLVSNSCIQNTVGWQTLCLVFNSSY